MGGCHLGFLSRKLFARCATRPLLVAVTITVTIAIVLTGCTGASDDDTPSNPDAATAHDAGLVADAPVPDASIPDASAPDAIPFVPEPIPLVDEAPAPPCPDSTPLYTFQFLDDTCGARRQPSSIDRDQRCPNAHRAAPDYFPSSTAPVVDADALVGLVPDTLDVTVFLIHRVDGVPHYRVLSNGSHDRAVQPWSTSKFLAAANAAANLRIASAYTVGLTASVDEYPLGDLITSLHNYDASPFSSNSIGRYLHDLGGRARANALIHEAWLGRPADESFGGNYGAAAPPLGHTLVEPVGDSVTLIPDSASGYANHLSMFTLADALRRLVLHREEPDLRLPGIQWADLRVLLHGAEDSARYGEWGGMSADKAIYLQAHDMDWIDRRSHGRWRSYSKLGNGSEGQFLDVGYACFPSLDDAGRPVLDAGVELVIAAHLPSGGATWAARDRLLASAFRAVVIRAIDGRL